MKCIALVLLVSSSVFAAPTDVIQKIGNGKDKNGVTREKKSPQMNFPFSLSPLSPFDPLASLGLSDLQLRKSEETSELGHHAQSRNYGSTSSPGSNAGAVGVFSNAKSSMAAIPLLLSCSPSIVSGQLSDAPAKPYYRSQSEIQTMTMNGGSHKVQRSAEQQLDILKHIPLEPSKTLDKEKEATLQGVKSRLEASDSSSETETKSVTIKQLEKLEKMRTHETSVKNEAIETEQKLRLEGLERSSKIGRSLKEKQLEHLKEKLTSGILEKASDTMPKEVTSQSEGLEESPTILTSADENLQKVILEQVKEAEGVKKDKFQAQLEGLGESRKIRRFADEKSNDHIEENPLDQSGQIDDANKTMHKIIRLRLNVKKEADH